MNALRRYAYSGLPSCNAVTLMAGGDIFCTTGCLGYGDCNKVCPVGAIRLNGGRLPIIDTEICIGCELCVKECPRSRFGLLSMQDADISVVVRCCSTAPIRDRRNTCSKCCIACRKCQKVCPTLAIQTVDRCATIDYDKCIGCGACVAVCPQGCIDLIGLAPTVSPGAARDSESQVPGVDAERVR